MVFNGEEEIGEIMLLGKKVKKVNNFKYLGSHLTSDGNLHVEINHRIKSGWNNWKNVSGVICDKKISARVKGKVHKTVVRPAMINGAEAWPIKKSQEKKLDVFEMKMLRWMCGVTKLDKIWNERIRGTNKVVEASKKVQERRLQCLHPMLVNVSEVRRGSAFLALRAPAFMCCSPRNHPRHRLGDITGLV
ncbi:uncharacterized protein LOC134776733 [Penaeus indicus]|uniref:uncharacterized protein LOC134776733 n=1 Tax=Penaeus indicus TaxID=29960 RepID=UPI00300DA9D6